MFMGKAEFSMHFETVSYLSDEGQLVAGFQNTLSDDALVNGYKAMLLTRLVDEKMITLQRQGQVSFALSSLGEEACAVATAAALDPGDWIYPQYRELGVMFWRGLSVQDYVDHMFGNANDIIKGRQMPNHFGSRKLNVVTVSSPLGTKIPHTAGCAYAMKVLKEPTIALCFFGEGAASEGDFHAGLNFAAVKRAPAIFFCRNNGYAISTALKDQFTPQGIARRGVAYGMETIRVDGNDYFAVYETVKKAREYCLEGNGPVLIEAMTYRMGAHSTSDDPSRYRQEKEVEEWKKKDPLKRLKKFMEKKGIWDDKREQETVKAYAGMISKAIEVSKNVGKPPLKTLVEDVYFEMTPTLKEQYEELKRFFPEG